MKKLAVATITFALMWGAALTLSVLVVAIEQRRGRLAEATPAAVVTVGKIPGRDGVYIRAVAIYDGNRWHTGTVTWGP